MLTQTMLEYLFTQTVLVNNYNTKETDPDAVLVALAGRCGIRIKKGHELAHRDMIRFVESRLGLNIPEPFYRGFPNSVKALVRDQFLYDQVVNYYVTYGLGDMSQPRHSVIEEISDNPYVISRSLFKEDVRFIDLDFIIVDEAEAEKMIMDIIDDLCLSTRPLTMTQMQLIHDVYVEFEYLPKKISSRQTLVEIVDITRDMTVARMMKLPDVLRLVDNMCCRAENKDMRSLNMKNVDRVFVTKVLDDFFEREEACDNMQIIECFEKQKTWVGLLHHIHYKAKCERAEVFLDSMRSKHNLSTYSKVEELILEGEICRAVDVLLEFKGSGALLRSLDYLLSRCKTQEELDYVISHTDTKNAIILMQLYLKYSRYTAPDAPRTFIWTKFYVTHTHRETKEEVARRKSKLTPEQSSMLASLMLDKLKALYANKLGKVYISPSMSRYGVPLSETASQSGFGVLTSGSRLPIPETKKIRAFTYWEKVDDIDLSAIGVDDEGNHIEFSWRTMGSLDKQTSIVYSGDVTSGYNGGSEYFDIEIEAFKAEYPTVRYIVFCDNVYSSSTFKECVCSAGYMLRDIEDSGEVFEPKTVRSSFAVTADSRFCYLFALDLTTNEFVWLNQAKGSNVNVAGETQFGFLVDYINVTKLLNVHDLFEMFATEVVDSVEEADVVVTDDGDLAASVPEGKEVIREFSTARMLALMNS